MENSECIPCGSTEIRDCDFRDEISQQYNAWVGGMCQNCQDAMVRSQRVQNLYGFEDDVENLYGFEDDNDPNPYHGTYSEE